MYRRYHCRPVPVSYTHLDVYKRQLLDEAVEWCKARGLEFYAVNKDYIGYTADTVRNTYNVDLTQHLQMYKAQMCIRDSDTSPTYKVLEEGANTLSKEETTRLAQRQLKFIQGLQAALVLSLIHI